MKSIVLINGKKQRKLNTFNRLIQFGDGLFETCLVVNGQLILAQQHFQRLEKGAERLQIQPVKRSIWLKDISKAVAMAKLDSAVVKILLSRGESERGYGFSKDMQSTRLVMVSKMPRLPEASHLSLCDSGYSINQLLAGIKHCNRLEQILARTQLKTQDCIMLDPQGQVISVTQGNIFAIKNGVLLTPSLVQCGIEGTRRQVIIELAKAHQYVVKICPLSVAALLDCDEVFITNSVMGIQPVGQINEKTYTQCTITHQLIKLFEAHISTHKNSIRLTPKKRRGKFVGWFMVSLLLVWLLWVDNINASKAVIYQVPIGANMHTTANNLKRLGWINSALFMRLVAKLSATDAQLKSGYYELTPDMSVYQLLDDFASANVAISNISLVEGQTVREYYHLLSQHPALTSNYSLQETLEKTPVNSPYEGYFWPDTYRVNYGDSVLSVLNRAQAILQENLNKAWNNRAKNYPLVSADQALILASLIEKETANNAEKPKIASVLINRLNKNMRLQIDSTVVYALGDAYTGKLSKQNLQIKSPYNTYRNKGLPPSAIGSVGQDSLRAALHPLNTEYLFFVAKKDGSHAFSKTYKQHLINIKKHLK